MTNEQAQQYLTLLEEAYYSGVRKVEYQGKITEFQSMKDMERAIARLNRKLNTNSCRKRKRQAIFNKGLT